jgi:hypothetical protein
MITCYLRYEIAPFKAKEFETYAKMWLKARGHWLRQINCYTGLLAGHNFLAAKRPPTEASCRPFRSADL